jgi:hypothetical protein
MAGKTTKELMAEYDALKAKFDALIEASKELVHQSEINIEAYKRLELQRDLWKMKALGGPEKVN